MNRNEKSLKLLSHLLAFLLAEKNDNVKVHHLRNYKLQFYNQSLFNFPLILRYNTITQKRISNFIKNALSKCTSL